MGKKKPSKRFLHVSRPNPTGLLSEREIDFDVDDGNLNSDSVPTVITSIIEQLNDPSKEERAYGCQYMARIVSQPKVVEHLLKKDVIKITAPLFLDSCVDVQKSALGAMRNMSVYGEEKVCDAMVHNDLITPLSVVIKKFGENFDSLSQGGATNQDVSAQILLEAVELLSNLCENNCRALQIFNKEGILSVLLPLLNPDAYGFPLSNAVAHCIHIVSESNADVSKVCRGPDVLSKLINIATSPHSSIDGVLFKTRTIGIMLNLCDFDLSQYYERFIQAIGEVLDMDHLPLISLMLDGSKDKEEEDNKSEVDLSQQDVDKLVAAQRVSLEMVANLCCQDDDEWEETEEEDGGDLEDCAEDGLESSDGAAGLEEEMAETLCLPSEIQAAFVKYNFVAKILKKANPLDQQQKKSLEELHCGGVISQRLEDLQARALLCLSNMVGVLDDTSPPGQIWTELYSLAKTYQGKNEDYIWAVTSAMRSVLQKLAEKEEAQITRTSQVDLEFMVSLGTVSTRPDTQINVVRMLSTIGCVLALKADFGHLVKTIGEILLQVCSANEDIVVVSETLDSLFDVFQEDETDPIAKQINLVQNLKAFQSSFKSKVSRERKNLGASQGIVMMARSNLAAFLKYKKARGL